MEVRYSKKLKRTTRTTSEKSSSLFVMKEEEEEEEEVRSRQYFATCIPGLESALSHELHHLGASNIRSSPNGSGGVFFEQNLNSNKNNHIGLESIMWCRTAHRIMEFLASSSSPINTREDLYHFIQSSLHIPSLLGNGQGGLLTLSVTAKYIGSSSSYYWPKDLTHSHYTALTVKNALIDAVREQRKDGQRPNVDLIDPDVPLVVVLQRRRRDYRQLEQWNEHDYQDYEDEEEEVGVDVTLYRCLHSTSLHKRGYRPSSNDFQKNSPSSSAVDEDDDDQDDDWHYNNNNHHQNKSPKKSFKDERDSIIIHKAALKESLAAGLLIETGWFDWVTNARQKNNNNNNNHPNSSSSSSSFTLIDPMTGSATFPIEAALMAADIAPGLIRLKRQQQQHHNNKNHSSKDNWLHPLPPVLRWKPSHPNPDFLISSTKKNDDIEKQWKECIRTAIQRSQLGLAWATSSSNDNKGLPKIQIWANDCHLGAISLARRAVKNAGVSSLISLDCVNCSQWDIYGNDKRNDYDDDEEEDHKRMIVANPPWGKRLSNNDHQDHENGVEQSWKDLATFLSKQKQQQHQNGDCTAHVLIGGTKQNMSLTRNLKLKKSRRQSLRTGEEHLKWITYPIMFVDKDGKKKMKKGESKQKVGLGAPAIPGNSWDII